MSWLLVAVGALAVGGAGMLWLRARFTVVDVTGPSMEPTLHHGDRVLVRRASPDRLRVGDIVVVENPDTADRPGPHPQPAPSVLSRVSGQAADRQWIVKRVAAAPGDPTPAILSGVEGITVGSPVPSDRLVLLGDNSDHSVDSRVHGFFHSEQVLGVMVRPMR